MSIWETIWTVGRFALIATSLSALLLMLLLLLHPLRFKLKLRSTVQGQRAELWFQYFFSLFKLGYIATPHTQDLVIKIAFWKKVIDRQQREKPEPPPEKPDETSPQSKEPAFSQKTPGSDDTKQQATPEADDKDSQAEKVKPASIQDEAPESAPEKTVAETTDISSEKTETSNSCHIPEEKPDEMIKADETTHEPDDAPEPIQPFAKKTVDDEKVSRKTIPEDDSADPGAKEPTVKERLRKIKKNISKKYQLGKKYLRLAMRKWKSVWPIVKRFWRRARSAFAIENPGLYLRYALHEPYITGMFQGTLAVVSGTLNRIGVLFEPVPVFSSPTVYARGNAEAVIKPWRLVTAFICLLFEKQLWTEMWGLGKYLWTNRVSLKKKFF